MPDILKDDDTLEAYWEEVRVKSPIRIVNTAASNISDTMELACVKTIFDLRQSFQAELNHPLTDTLLLEVLTRAVRRFLEHWKNGLADQNVSGLIEVVLQGQGLSTVDMKGFVRALPTSLVIKIAQSGIGISNGVHGLMGVECAFREGRLTGDYIIGRDVSNDKVFIELTHNSGGEPRQVRFTLDEEFPI